MKTTPAKPTPPRSQKPRSFAWAVRSSEIGFMHADEAEAAMEGSSSSNCQDCSAIAPFDQPRPRRPAHSGRTAGSD